MKEIPLGRSGKVTIVDDADHGWLTQWKWHLNAKGYVVRQVDRIDPETRVRHSRDVRMHRLILNPPEDMAVDHINGDKLDNRRANLRICTSAQNSFNQDKQQRNTSGFKGVNRNRNRWEARISCYGVRKYLGAYATPEIAYEAYRRAAKEMHGEFARESWRDSLRRLEGAGGETSNED